MQNIRSVTTLLVAGAFGVSCATAASRGSSAPDIPAESLMSHVSVLAADSMEGRLVGSAGSAKARRYILGQYAAAGLQPIGSSFERPFEFRPGNDTSRVIRGVNLVGVVPGNRDASKYIVVTAHYDHLGVREGQIYNGADDNASGTATIIELARWFSRNRPAHSVMIVAFDAEEGGLRGAREFVRQPPVPLDQIVVNVNLDMVGRNVSNELYAAGTMHYPFLRPYLDSVASRSGLRLRFGHDDPAGPPGSDWTSQSDHGAFHQARVPFVYFGEEDHPDYHKPTDDVERIMPQFLAAAASTIGDAIRVFDRNLAAISAAAPAVERTSIQYRPASGVAFRAMRDTGTVARAMVVFRRDSASPQRYVEVATAQSGSRQFREAIETLSRGLARWPNDVELLRWRGHRYISVREFDRALADLTRAYSLDSTHYGVLYHLGIVRFVRGEFDMAADAFRRAQGRAPTASELAGSTDWLWTALARAGRDAEAREMLARKPDSLAVSNAYARRLQLYRGEITPDAVFTPADTADVQSATLAFGVGNWYLTRGDTTRARQWFERSIASGGWPAFGYILSEVELQRTRP